MTCCSCAPVGVWVWPSQDLKRVIFSNLKSTFSSKRTFYISCFNPGQTWSKPNNPHLSIGFLNSTSFYFHSERRPVGRHASRPTEKKKFTMMSLNRVWCRCCSIRQEENHSECIVIEGLRLTTWCWTVTPCSSQHLGRKLPVVAFSFFFFFLFIEVLHEIWTCSKSPWGQRKSALMFWLSSLQTPCSCFAAGLQEITLF